MATSRRASKNIDGAKDFLRYLIQPTNLDTYLKEARGRWLPVMESIVKTDPYWLDPATRIGRVAIKQGVLGPTTVWPTVYNPGFAQVDAEHLWGVAEADVINGMKPEDATDKAFKQIAKIFAKYQTA